MIIHGHNFLRSDFKRGDPVRVTAGAVNARRVADILKHWQGIGCSLLKPVDCEGKNWLIDMYHSDIQPPDGLPDPWEYHRQDQFLVKRVPSQTQFYIYGGTWLSLSPIYYDGILPAPAIPVSWRDDSDSDGYVDGYPGELSHPIPIADGESLKVYAFAADLDPDGTWDTVTLAVFDAAADVAAYVATELAGATITYELVATVTRDDAAASGPKIIIEQALENFNVIAPPTTDHVAVHGGVWQIGAGTETVVVPVTDGDITWPDGEADDDGHVSNPYACGEAAESTIWARLDLTSATPALTLKVLTADPTWADGVHWLKIATISAAGLPGDGDDPDDFDPAQVTLDVEQHHSGSIHWTPGRHGVLDAYSVDNALGSSSAEPPTTADWFPVLIGGGTVRYIDSDTFTASASGDGNTVVFDDDQDGRMFLVILTGMFKIAASGSAGAGTAKFSMQEVALCKGSGSGSKGTTIHPLCLRKWSCLQTPAFQSGDTPPISIPANTDNAASFAMATLIVPSSDLTNNTLSVWARGRGVIDAELVIVELHDPAYEVPS